jgi:zinc transport system ATP-binding protein
MNNPLRHAHEPIILAKNLAFAYDRIPVLEDVNLSVNAHDSICIVGPNGGGKTTLLKLILGLLKPDRGEIRVFGGSPADARLRIGYVPQYAHYDPHFPVTVLDVVLLGRLGRRFGGPYTAADKQGALAALAEMRMTDLAGQLFAAISGGQRQRVLIARALACDAEILILDEPTANIDAQTEINLFEILSELNKQMTIMLVTHDVGFAAKFFKSIACVNRQVIMHPTSELTGELIQDLYGGDMCMIRHDYRQG